MSEMVQRGWPREGEGAGRVLFIGPRFFGYESIIESELVNQGFSVHFMDERPSNSSLGRAAARLIPAVTARMTQKYFLEEWKKIEGDRFTHIFVLKGELLPQNFLDLIMTAWPTARRILYTFDSFEESPRAQSLSKHFHDCYTFDPNDAATHRDFEYLPLFHAPQFSLARVSAQEERAFDLTFLGTVHSDRYRIARGITNRVVRTREFYYHPALWVLVIQRIWDPTLRAVPLKAVSFQKLSTGEVAEIFACSRAVVDIPRETQKGLTMRTFEVLASGASLVTTNRQILSEPFYDPSSIYVHDPLHPDWSSFDSWLDETQAIDPEALRAYSVEAWVAHLFAGGA